MYIPKKACFPKIFIQYYLKPTSISLSLQLYDTSNISFLGKTLYCSLLEIRMASSTK